MQPFKYAPAILAALIAAPAAHSAPIELNTLYDPFFGNVKDEGYLEFINPREFPNLIGTPVPTSPPGQIQTEEYTGFTRADGRDVIERGDSDTTAGDRADFDWVQENRPCETGGVCNNAPQAVNHPGQVGAMGWTVGTPEVSPHVDPGTGAAHAHSDEENPPGPLPHLDNVAYDRDFFEAVDVFSIISIDQDTDVDINDPLSLRNAALDYTLDFANTVTGAFSPGVISIIWIPGWTAATFIDDYVARWLPTTPGQYNVVAIEPIGNFPGDYEATEIDAIKALHLPEPTSVLLLGGALAALGLRRRREGRRHPR